jgi:transposase
MDHFAGLDVSVKESSVCIVGDAGRIVREVIVAIIDNSIKSVMKWTGGRTKKINALDIAKQLWEQSRDKEATVKS